MELPALLPKELEYLAIADTDRRLHGMLTKIPQDLILFFEYACADETWSQYHDQFMRDTIQWLTEQLFQGKLQVDYGQRAVKAIHEHFQIQLPYVKNNLTIQYNGSTSEVNSLLWGASSDFFYHVIRQECREKNTKTLEFEDISPEVFVQIEEFVNTGTVQELWRKEQHEIIKVIRQAQDWGLKQLVTFCEDILKRYITRSNVVETLISAHEERWTTLEKNCKTFINNLEVGVQFEETISENFVMEILDYHVETMEIFENLRFFITHLIFRGALTEDPNFGEMVNRCPKLIGLEISNTDQFTNQLLEIPENLQELNISRCHWIDSKKLKKISEICPNLTSLKIAGNPQLNYSAWGVLNQFQKLEKIDISSCPQIKDEDFKMILQACRQITHLVMQKCEGLSNQSYLQIAMQLPNLTDLDLSRCNLLDAALVDIATKCKQLITLNLTRCRNITERGILEAVRNASNLRSLDITKCNLTRRALNQINEYRPFLELFA